MKWLRKFLTFLASMGLTVKDDRPKVIDVVNREWGEPAGGLAFSIKEAAKEDPRQPPVLSVVLRNVGSERRLLSIPGWLFFCQIETGAPLTAYGRELPKPERRTEKIDFALGPGDATEADLPIGLLYEMRAPGTYTVRVSCQLPEGIPLSSNPINVTC
jgi:hypothetical protein